ncbi:MAG: GntR family transcriptional regulator [Oscillospiraceae bacterium]|nr:GntR family transcriptional regulator [Oscillospiraceae bacterium]
MVGKDDIIFGRLRSGELLILQKICAQMNVSSAPVREALNMLSKEGLVDLPPHKRASVSRLEMEDIDVIVFMRCMLEPYAARLSVGKIPQKALDDMRELLFHVLNHLDDAELYVASDLALHELLHMYCGSTLLSEIISRLKDKSIRLRYVSEHFSKGNSEDLENQMKVIQTVTEEHLEILSAIETGNTEIVHQKVSQHIMQYSIRLNNERPFILDAIAQGKL